MPLVAAKCPGCGAAIQLPSERQNANCMYCGISVFVEEAVKLAISTGPSAETLIELGNASLSGNRHEEAFGYFTRAIEADISNPTAWLGKAKASIGLATLADMRQEEILFCSTKHIELSGDKAESASTVVPLLSNFALALSKAVQDRFTKFGGTLVGPMGSMINTARESALVEWLNGIMSSVSIHCDAVALAKEHCESALLHAWECQLRTLLGFVERSFYATVQITADFTDGRSHHSSGSVLMRIPEDTSMTLFRLYDSTRDKFIALNPAGAQEFGVLNELLGEQNKEAEAANSMCFVATACYGAPDADNVLILRRFRDDILMTTSIGRSLIHYYYKRGPAVAQFISTREHLRSFVRVSVCAPAAMVAILVLALKSSKK